MIRNVTALVLSLMACSSYSWNAMGHQLVAQIAYDNLTPKAKKMCNYYNRSLDKFSRSRNFVVAATWLDAIRAKDMHWFDSLHYIDIPYSNDGTPLPPIPESNALVGIKQSLDVLRSTKTSAADKGLALRIVTHVVGDIHQPLHTIAQISNQHPHGDMGGNLFPLEHNSIGNNLHQYWDNGGGVLLGQSKHFQIQNKARYLEGKWSCKSLNTSKKPAQWVRETHKIALTQVYNLPQGTLPSKRYQLNVQNTSQKQIVIAGCRLASLLNSL